MSTRTSDKKQTTSEATEALDTHPILQPVKSAEAKPLTSDESPAPEDSKHSDPFNFVMDELKKASTTAKPRNAAAHGAKMKMSKSADTGLNSDPQAPSNSTRSWSKGQIPTAAVQVEMIKDSDEDLPSRRKEYMTSDSPDW